MPDRQTEYLNKELAAKHTGLSPRRLCDLAQHGYIRKKFEVDPKSKRQIAVFATEDLDKIVRGESSQTWASPDTRKVSVAAMQQPTNGGIDAMARGADGRLTPIEAKHYNRPWMTADEAADRTGLPASFLLGLVVAGKLPALDVGVRPGGRYRIAWRDLEMLTGERITRGERVIGT